MQSAFLRPKSATLREDQVRAHKNFPTNGSKSWILWHKTSSTKYEFHRKYLQHGMRNKF